MRHAAGERIKAFSWIVSAALIGGLLGAGLAWVNAAGVLQPWARLAAPPQAAVRLLAAADAYAVVADGSGQLYLYQRFTDIWAPLDPGQAAAYPDQGLAAPANRFMPAPPDGALGVDYVLDPSQGSAVDYGAYALGPDGSVWAWFKSDTPAARQANWQLALGGAALGLALGLAGWGARHVLITSKNR